MYVNNLNKFLYIYIIFLLLFVKVYYKYINNNKEPPSLIEQ